MSKKTDQKLFDRIAKHLLQQGRASRPRAKAACRYRYGGLRCAVGCVIPDRYYDPALEGRNIFVLKIDANSANVGPKRKRTAKRLLAYFARRGYSLTLLWRLQLLHDMKPVVDWSACLYDIAADYSLDNSVVTKYLARRLESRGSVRN